METFQVSLGFSLEAVFARLNTLDTGRLLHSLNSSYISIQSNLTSPKFLWLMLLCKQIIAFLH